MDPTKLTPAGDQYSLGCTLYYLLSGQYPFPDGNAADKMMAHQFKQAKPLAELNPDVPPGLVEIVERLMQKAPEQRYHSTTEVVEALRHFASKPDGLLPRSRGGSANGLTPKSSPGFGQGSKSASGMRPNPGVDVRPKTSLPGVGPKSLPGLTPGGLAASAGGPKSAPAFGARPGSANGLSSRPARPVTVAPSSPTPRPQAVGGLPTRDSVRSSAVHRPATMIAGVPATPVHEPAVEDPDLPPSSHHDRHEVPGDPSRRVIPGDFGGELDSSSWDDRLGPIGIAMSAGIACAVVYFLAVMFQLF